MLIIFVKCSIRDTTEQEHNKSQANLYSIYRRDINVELKYHKYHKIK